jgi:hypothetical protein
MCSPITTTLLRKCALAGSSDTEATQIEDQWATSCPIVDIVDHAFIDALENH